MFQSRLERSAAIADAVRATTLIEPLEDRRLLSGGHWGGGGMDAGRSFGGPASVSINADVSCPPEQFVPATRPAPMGLRSIALGGEFADFHHSGATESFGHGDMVFISHGPVFTQAPFFTQVPSFTIIEVSSSPNGMVRPPQYDPPPAEDGRMPPGREPYSASDRPDQVLGSGGNHSIDSDGPSSRPDTVRGPAALPRRDDLSPDRPSDAPVRLARAENVRRPASENGSTTADVSPTRGGETPTSATPVKVATAAPMAAESVAVRVSPPASAGVSREMASAPFASASLLVAKAVIGAAENNVSAVHTAAATLSTLSLSAAQLSDPGPFNFSDVPGQSGVLMTGTLLGLSPWRLAKVDIGDEWQWWQTTAAVSFLVAVSGFYYTRMVAADRLMREQAAKVQCPRARQGHRVVKSRVIR